MWRAGTALGPGLVTPERPSRSVTWTPITVQPLFYRLRDLHNGDILTVTSVTGPQRFHVDTVALFPKTAFPTAQVYGPVTDRALRLVTCGGTFNDPRNSYEDNVIVFATAV